jgi:hypothetical protein
MPQLDRPFAKTVSKVQNRNTGFVIPEECPDPDAFFKPQILRQQAVSVSIDTVVETVFRYNSLDIDPGDSYTGNGLRGGNYNFVKPVGRAFSINLSKIQSTSDLIIGGTITRNSNGMVTAVLTLSGTVGVNGNITVTWDDFSKNPSYTVTGSLSDTATACERRGG